MKSANIPEKKVNKKAINKKKTINRDKVIKKRIEILLSVGTVGLVMGLIIGILLPIGKVKKSDYIELKKSNEKIQSELNNANKKIDELNNELEESKAFTNLEKEEKEQVINYINELISEDENNIASEGKTVKTTNIFETVYKSYAYSVGYGSFDDFKAVIDTFGYQYNISEEVDTNKVTLKDEYAGENVALNFEKINDSQELVLKSIRYNKGDKFVEVNNNTDKAEMEYITYDGTKVKVKNVDEQAKFLFSE